MSERVLIDLAEQARDNSAALIAGSAILVTAGSILLRSVYRWAVRQFSDVESMKSNIPVDAVIPEYPISPETHSGQPGDL